MMKRLYLKQHAELTLSAAETELLLDAITWKIMSGRAQQKSLRRIPKKLAWVKFNQKKVVDDESTIKLTELEILALLSVLNNRPIGDYGFKRCCQKLEYKVRVAISKVLDQRMRNNITRFYGNLDMINRYEYECQDPPVELEKPLSTERLLQAI
jgi:hypothetical protein